MPVDLITFQGPAAGEAQERSAITVRASFRDQAAAIDAAPTNVYYRLDDDGSGVVLQDWTPLAAPVLPTDYVDVPLTAENNRIVNETRGLERKTLTVMADRGLASQFVGQYGYQVRNLGWLS